MRRYGSVVVFSAFLAFWLDSPWWAVPGLAVPASALTAWGLYRRRAAECSPHMTGVDHRP
ncbi:hypothetical protein [Kitasatospora sp. NPDC051914]|uniref:hypothetical protein n=1 Tax=Kitasatospora sp. NPDC051914 TaxID=3154945 RepID=UPI0034300E02